MARIALIIGHPDSRSERFCRAIADAYAAGARGARHDVRVIDIATMDLPLVRRRDLWEQDPPPPDVQTAQSAIAWADHLVIVYPLWLGTMPALLKGFLEQVFRPGFAFPKGEIGLKFDKPLAGKSARIIVTMGMPAVIYRVYFRAHSLKNLERNILKFIGIRPVRETLIGLVESPKPAARAKWLEKVRALGAAAR